MDLIVWRHAEAVDGALLDEDMSRKLTARGEKQAARMAAWLERQLPHRTRIWVSPARRCQQTALALTPKFKTHDDIAPDGSAERLLALVQWPTYEGTVLVVGHQPTLGQVVAQLMGLSAGECVIKKGALWWLRVRQSDGDAATQLLTVQSPDLL